MSNKELWDRVSKTDPKHVKPITGKQYSGNSPKPYYIVERLTEEFGPCGTGWGFTVVNERFERFSETDSLHVALVNFWYVLDGKRAEFQQMGQTKASYVTNAGKFMLDEDAPKKSVTDALVKCASYLGFAGDIFSGRWDDSKYVAELKREFAEKDEPVAEIKRTGAMAAVLETVKVPEVEAEYIRELAENVKDLFASNGVKTVYERIESENLESEHKILLWSWLPSEIRSALKREGASRAIKAAA